MKISSSSSLLLSLLPLNIASVNAQFTCTLTAQDESSCLDGTDDDGSHCVWCAVGGLGFCVDESQAEKMEDSIPGIECDRNSDNTDDDSTPKPTDDDATPPPPPPTPDDDTVPDNFWSCLQDKTAAACKKDTCTWCDTKGGFGLCLTGPAADSASDSDWFDCGKSSFEDKEEMEDAVISDPYDTACLLTYLQDPTEEGCHAAFDQDGNACEYCDLQGNLNLCLNEEQAELGQQIGLTCSASSNKEKKTDPAFMAKIMADVKDPYDPTCVLAFLQDQSKETCVNTNDSDGNSCEYCTLQGSLNLCLNEEQAEAGQQLGIECDGHEDELVAEEEVKDPYDPTCVLAFLQDQSKETCVNTNDADGNSCEYCTLQGSLNLCLNEEQAQMGQQLGIECDGRDDKSSNKKLTSFLRLGLGSIVTET